MTAAEIHFGAIIELVLRYFDTPALAHQWSSLARVCRGWAKVVAQFDLTALTPRQLYYDAAAIVRHNIAPSFAVWWLLPHNVAPRKPEADVEHTVEVSLEAYPRLGWSSGADAVVALARRWGPHPGWGQLRGLWRTNGATEALRISELYDAPPNRKWDLCTTKGNNHAGSGFLSHERMMRIISIMQAVSMGTFAFTSIHDHRQSNLLIAIDWVIPETTIVEPQTVKAFDLLDHSSFNLVVMRAIFMEEHHGITNYLNLLAQSNRAWPRYEPLYYVPRLGAERIAETLAAMTPGSVSPSPPHPYDVHDPAACDGCRSLRAHQ